MSIPFDTIKKLALSAGAARFYPDKQVTKEDAYLVSQNFLEKFANLIEQHIKESKDDSSVS